MTPNHHLFHKIQDSDSQSKPNHNSRMSRHKVSKQNIITIILIGFILVIALVSIVCGLGKQPPSSKQAYDTEAHHTPSSKIKHHRQHHILKYNTNNSNSTNNDNVDGNNSTSTNENSNDNESRNNSITTVPKHYPTSQHGEKTINNGGNNTSNNINHHNVPTTHNSSNQGQSSAGDSNRIPSSTNTNSMKVNSMKAK